MFEQTVNDSDRNEVNGRRLARGVCRMLADQGYRALCELPLSNARRPDIFALDRRGGILIVEVKS